MLFFVTILATSGTLAVSGMAPLAGFVSPILVEAPLDLAGSLLMTFFAISLESFLMLLVLERYLSHFGCSKLDDVSSEAGSRKRDNG